jgi:hypothetical protein
MSTIAFPGFGSKLANGGTSGSSYTNVAQCKNVKLSAGKIKTDDITNLDSPAIGGGAVYQEIIKTMVEADTCTFDFVVNPADPTTEGLLTGLQASPSSSLQYWRLTTTDGSTLIFQGYSASFDIDVTFDKAITGKGSVKISGPVTVTWS